MERENELNLQFLLLVHRRQSIILFTAWTPSVAGRALERRMTHRRSPHLFLFCSLLIMALIVSVWGSAGAHGSQRFTWFRTSGRVCVFCAAPDIVSCFALTTKFLQFGSRNNAGRVQTHCEYWTSKANNLEEIVSWKLSELFKFTHRLWRH